MTSTQYHTKLERELLEMPLRQLCAKIANGELEPNILLRLASLNHGRYDARLSAYREWTGAEAQPKGVFRGIPISIKDSYGMPGARTFAGSPKQLPKKWEREGPFLGAFRQLGASVVGRTHMVEFAFGAVGANAHWPVPVNPWGTDCHRVPAGSSSGAGVSLLEGSALIALGSDTAGSVRLPASYAGVVGMMPARGRWSTNGIIPLSETFDSPGYLTRTAADARFVFDLIDPILTGTPANMLSSEMDLNHIVIGLDQNHFWSDCPDDISSPVMEAVQKIATKGAKIKELHLNEPALAFQALQQNGVAISEFRNFIRTQLPEWEALMGNSMQKRIETALEIDSDAFRSHQGLFAQLSSSMHETMADIDILVSPTTTLSAPKFENVIDPVSHAKANTQILRNTSIANLLGLCAITIPVGKDSNGFPVGMQFLARAGSERLLVLVAESVERVIGTGREILGTAPLLKPINN